jgi:hypothetical protein
MLVCTQNETKMVLDQGVRCVTRPAPGQHPYAAHGGLMLASQYVPGTDGVKPMPFATATITSVRPTTVEAMRRDAEACKLDGFSSPAAWWGHMRLNFKSVHAGDRLVQIQFHVDRMEKDPSKLLGVSPESQKEQID